MIRVSSIRSAVLPIVFSIFLIACSDGSSDSSSDGLSEAAKRNNAGVELQQKGLIDQAIGEYGGAIRLDPQLADPYYNRGNAYYHMKVYGKAIEDYSEAIRLDPDYAAAYANRAQAYTLLGMDTRAQQDVDQAAALGIDRATLDRVIERIRSQR